MARQRLKQPSIARRARARVLSAGKTQCPCRPSAEVLGATSTFHLLCKVLKHLTVLTERGAACRLTRSAGKRGNEPAQNLPIGQSFKHRIGAFSMDQEPHARVNECNHTRGVGFRLAVTPCPHRRAGRVGSLGQCPCIGASRARNIGRLRRRRSSSRACACTRRLNILISGVFAVHGARRCRKGGTVASKSGGVSHPAAAVTSCPCAAAQRMPPTLWQLATHKRRGNSRRSWCGVSGRKRGATFACRRRRPKDPPRLRDNA